MTVRDYINLLLPNTIIIINEIGKNEKDIKIQAYQIPTELLEKTIQTLTYDTIDISDSNSIVTNTSANIPNLIVNNDSQYVCPVIIT